MPEHRARDHHRSRVAEALREEIELIIEGELADPRIGSARVTEVALQPGGRSGLVYVSVVGDEVAEQHTLEALRSARGYIRSSLLDRMGTRNVPDLSFHIDRTDKLTARIDTLLDRTRKRQKRASAAAAARAGAGQVRP